MMFTRDGEPLKAAVYWVIGMNRWFASA